MTNHQRGKASSASFTMQHKCPAQSRYAGVGDSTDLRPQEVVCKVFLLGHSCNQKWVVRRPEAEDWHLME